MTRATTRLRSACREVLGLGLPAGLALLLFHSSPFTLLGEGERGKEKAIPRLCAEEHRGGGESGPLDLSRTKAAYAELRSKMTFATAKDATRFQDALGRPYDLGLPACRGREERREALAVTVPPEYRKKKLWFVNAPDPSRVRLPDPLKADPGVEVFVLTTSRPKDLGALSRELGRSVSLASPDLIRALKIRCAGTWTEFSEKGDALVLHEGD